MKNSFFVVAIMLISFCTKAQQVTDLQEKTPFQNNGIEYGYYITNERSKEVKGDDYDRYEVSLYVTNKSGCTKIIPFPEATYTGSSSNTSEDGMLLAEFNCRNANGKRLTSKSGKVNAKPWYTYTRVPEDPQATKFRMIKAQAGYAIKNGETINAKIIVIVPKGERPVMQCRTVYYPDF